jgi:RluA family pseudouridine synthase
MITILFEDPHLLIVDKPVGLLSIADGYDKTIPHLRSILEPDHGRLWVVHRLDKETSGIVILARSAQAHRELNLQFTAHTIRKEYIALVSGECPAAFLVDLPLLVNGDRRHRTVIDRENGKPALTEFSSSEHYSLQCTLLNVFPHTGYTHQIRAHLLSAGFPILGDQLYANESSTKLVEKLDIHRVALHAAGINFIHPLTGQALSIRSDLPHDFLEMISNCRTKKEYR